MWRIAIACLLAAGCGPVAQGDVTSADGADGSDDTPRLDLSTRDVAPASGYRWVSAGFEGPCVVREPDGDIACRDLACDRGQRPEDWRLDDPACWRSTALAGNYARVEAQGVYWGVSAPMVCGLTRDGGVECDPAAPKLPVDTYSAIAVDVRQICALGTNGASCVPTDALGDAAATWADVSAVDRAVLLTDAGVVALDVAQADAPIIPGTFVAATGGHFDACGLREDGGWSCIPRAHESAIAECGTLFEVELASLGPADDWADGCGLDEGGSARCWGRLRDRLGELVQLTAAELVGEAILGGAPIPYACAIDQLGALACWGPLEGWCDVVLCHPDEHCEAGTCYDCGEAGC